MKEEGRKRKAKDVKSKKRNDEKSKKRNGEKSNKEDTRFKMKYTSGKDGKVKSYKPGDDVLYKSPKSPLPKWLPVKIVKRVSTLVYLIKIVSGNIRLAHGFQLKPIIIRTLKNTIQMNKLPSQIKCLAASQMKNTT